MIARPSLDEVVDQAVDLDLGADVDAAGRLVEDEDARLRLEPFREHDLLLVAAGERAGLRRDRRRSIERRSRNELGGGPLLGRSDEPDPFQEAVAARGG